MNVTPLIVPRPQSAATHAEIAEGNDFDALVESLETLLFTGYASADRLDSAVLSASLHEVQARWPQSA